MGLWILTRLKLRTDQVTTHRSSSRGQFVLVRLDKREKYTIQAKNALLCMCSNCIVYLCYPVSLMDINKITVVVVVVLTSGHFQEKYMYSFCFIVGYFYVITQCPKVNKHSTKCA